MSLPWLKVCAVEDPALAATLERRVVDRRNAGNFTLDNQLYIRDVSLAVSKNSDFTVSGERAEILRRLCTLYRIGFHEKEITSHRPVIGAGIVFFKKALYRLLKPLLLPVFKQQTMYNATVVHLLAQLANEAGDTSDRKTQEK
jgi:hypothetical protein